VRALNFTIATVAGIGVVSVAIWAVRYAPWVEQTQRRENKIERAIRDSKVAKALNSGQVPEIAFGKQPVIGHDRDLESAPPPAAGPLFPKVQVTSATVFDFGTMVVNEEGHHTFRIENKGDAPLLLAKGPTECKCAVSQLSTHEVPPGGHADVEIRWKSPSAEDDFSKDAIIWSNDPKWPVIRFSISGRVPPEAVFAPGLCNAGTVTDERDGQAKGTLTSEVADNFQITSVQPADPNVQVDFKPLPKDGLKKAGLRSGYEFTIKVSKGIPIGRWRSTMRIVTTLKGNMAIDVALTAMRTGPIAFLPAVPIVGEAFWNNEQLLLNLGTFKAAQGSKAAVPAFIGGMKDPFQILAVSSSDPFVKLSLERDSKGVAGGRQEVRFVFEVPPGAPAVTRLVKAPIHVSVTTNHPTVPKIDFQIAYVAS
jgi:hypothetical protein